MFGWFLAGIYTASELEKVLVLKGGNCFRKAYFPKTRYSNDLVFSVRTALPEDYLRAELGKVCDYVSDVADVQFYKEKSLVQSKRHADKEKQVIEARLYFNDFYSED